MLKYEPCQDSFRVGEGVPAAFPLHLHAAIEMIYVQQDCAFLQLEGQTLPVRAGEAAFIFPNLLHGYGEVPSEKMQGHVKAAMIIALPQEAEGYARELFSLHPQKMHFAKEEIPQEAPEIFSQILRYRMEGNLRVARAYLQLLLALFWPRLQLIPNEFKQEPDLLHGALAYLNEHFREPVSLEDVSRQLGASRYQVSRLFSGQLQMGFVAYLNALRIQEAQKLLRETDLPVTELAFSCGFETPRTFNRVFQAQCGCAPSSYRKQGRE